MFFDINKNYLDLQNTTSEKYMSISNYCGLLTKMRIPRLNREHYPLLNYCQVLRMCVQEPDVEIVADAITYMKEFC